MFAADRGLDMKAGVPRPELHPVEIGDDLVGAFGELVELDERYAHA